MDSCKQKIKEQTFELTKRFEPKGNTPKIVDKDIVKALKKQEKLCLVTGQVNQRGI